MAVSRVHARVLVLGRTSIEDGVIRMGLSLVSKNFGFGAARLPAYLDMLLQILGPLERLAAKITLVRLEGHVNTDVGGDVVALRAGDVAVAPSAGEAEVVGGLAADVVVAEVVVEDLGVGEGAGAVLPETLVRG